MSETIQVLVLVEVVIGSLVGLAGMIVVYYTLFGATMRGIKALGSKEFWTSKQNGWALKAMVIWMGVVLVGQIIIALVGAIRAAD